MTPDHRKALERAGITIPAGAKVARLRPGEEVVAFAIPSRAVPWKAPTTTRTGHAFKDKKLVAWQEEVALYATRAMAGRPPYPWPVCVWVTFTLKRKAGRPPDLSNLVKASEDALNGIAIDDDTQVERIVSARSLGEEDAVYVGVYAIGEGS